MCEVKIKVPDEVLLDLHESKVDFTEYVRRKIAIDLYKEKKVSLGYCAEMAEMSKEDFISLLGEKHISIFSFTDENEFVEEFANA